MLYKIALYIFYIFLILDIQKAKDIENILKKGFISIVMMIGMLIAIIHNETSKRMVHLRQVRKRNKSRAVGYKLNHEKQHIKYNIRLMQ